jgi:predicted site-specific integrase-resolvase
MPDQQTPDLIGTVEACRILGIDRSTLSRWVNHREPKVRPVMQLSGDGRMLFRRADVDALRDVKRQSA